MTDLLAQNKMNVFHWHMTDDASFPWKSLLFPNMSLFGAYQPTTHVYSLDQVRDVIEYARIRGVRVIPEFDTPGHTHSWFGGEPAKLLTECYDDMGQIIPNKFGPINPVREENLARYAPKNAHFVWKMKENFTSCHFAKHTKQENNF